MAGRCTGACSTAETSMLKRLRKRWLACRDDWTDIAEVQHSVRLGDVCVVQPHCNVGVDAPNAPYVEELQAKQGLSLHHTADSFQELQGLTLLGESTASDFVESA